MLRHVAGIESKSVGGSNLLNPTMPTGAPAGKMSMAKRLEGDNSKMDVNDADVDVDKFNVAAGDTPYPVSPGVQEPELRPGLKLAMQLTFAMLSHTLCHPFRRPSKYATPTLNPYNTIMLTFLATVMGDPSARSVLQGSIPW